MAERDEFEVQMMLSFDHEVYVEDDVVGLEVPVALPSFGGELRFPGARRKDTRALSPPRAAGDAVEKYLPEEVWGVEAEGDPRIYMTGAMVAVQGRGPLPESIESDQFQGGDMKKLVEEVADWWESFCRWIWTITTQSLNATYPDPRVLHRSSKTVITRLLRGSEASLPASAAPALTIYEIPTCQYSERLLGAAVVQVAARTPSEPPVIMELMASARMAARRGDRRRSMIDAGTAAEAALAVLLRLPTNHRMTLGALVTSARDSGVPLPQDVETKLVLNRNGAIHRGTSPTPADLDRCLSIVEDLVVQVEPLYVPVSTMKAFGRPQRHDLLIITAPRRAAD